MKRAPEAMQRLAKDSDGAAVWIAYGGYAGGMAPRRDKLATQDSGGGGTPGGATQEPVTPSSRVPDGHHPGTH